MKNFKALALATITALASFAPAAEAKNVDQAHINLARQIERTGITLKINPKRCWQKESYGWYWAARSEMVVCQENKRQVGVETYWTGEDLDTLRHEAQHLIQDCMDGSLNGDLDSVYKQPYILAADVLGMPKARSIVRLYSDASEHIQAMELEAFAVAALNDPNEQSADIQKYCF